MWFARCWHYRHLESNTKLIGRPVPEIVIWIFLMLNFMKSLLTIHYPWRPLRLDIPIGEQCDNISAYSDKNCRRRSILKNWEQRDRMTNSRTDTSIWGRSKLSNIILRSVVLAKPCSSVYVISARSKSIHRSCWWANICSFSQHQRSSSRGSAVLWCPFTSVHLRKSIDLNM